MVDASSTGSGQHKIKTINVEVNLLDAWSTQRSELEAKILKKFAVLAAILLAAIGLLPVLSSFGSDNARQLKSATAALEDRQKFFNHLDSQVKVLNPSIERDTLVTQCHGYSQQVIDEVARIVNASPTGVFFDQMNIEVTNGDLTVKLAANAMSPALARQFVEAAGQGNNVISSTQTSIKQTQLSDTSIKFDYIKKVSISQ